MNSNNDTSALSKVALSCSQISQLDGSWGTKSPAISDVPWCHPWPISEAPWPQSLWPHHASPLTTLPILQQYYSNTTAIHYGTVLQLPTTSMRGLPSTNFHQFPPGNNFLVHCERIVTSSRCCKQRSGARKTWGSQDWSF